MTNKVILIGRLTKDIDLRKTNSGKSFTRFTLAVNRPIYKDNQEQTADFISCVAWEKTADILANFCEKGSQICAEGTIQTGSYQNQQNVTVYTTDVLVQRIELLGSNNKQEKKTSYANTAKVDTSNVPFDEPVQDIDISPDDLPFY